MLRFSRFRDIDYSGSSATGIARAAAHCSFHLHFTHLISYSVLTSRLAKKPRGLNQCSYFKLMLIVVIL